jgi:GNAT superfamily N-acetyltransferase
MNAATVSLRPAVAADRPAILELAPRLAEGVAPWRNHDEARNAGRKWLDGSIDDARSRRGLGRALIDAAEDWAREHQLENLTLHTGAYNTSARAFYAAQGFDEEEVRLTRRVRR